MRNQVVLPYYRLIQFLKYVPDQKYSILTDVILFGDYEIDYKLMIIISIIIMHFRNINVKFKQNLVEFELKPRSHNSNIEKLKSTRKIDPY